MTSLPWTPDARGVAAAAGAVLAGGVIGFPTDTVYGLACLAERSTGVADLYQIKGRPRTYALIVMAASVEALSRFVLWDDRARSLAAKFWPGPLTLVLPARGAGYELGRDGTLGVRIPDHPVALALLGQSAPLATTSANRHGRPPVPDAAAALAQLPGLVGALAEVVTGRGSTEPSSILDLTRDQPVLIREGRLSARELGVPAPEQNPEIRRD
ncbi:MAG TPA: L-threonylcarbamoyladenylate synthase [Candidatus Dormibacteraeota bacterium]|nr:L-threonylcarbamoyladenylate synthase [Candidatus Dormibacteraeota bacterium]